MPTPWSIHDKGASLANQSFDNVRRVYAQPHNSVYIKNKWLNKITWTRLTHGSKRWAMFGQSLAQQLHTWPM